MRGMATKITKTKLISMGICIICALVYYKTHSHIVGQVMVFTGIIGVIAYNLED